MSMKVSAVAEIRRTGDSISPETPEDESRGTEKVGVLPDGTRRKNPQLTPGTQLPSQ